MPRNRVQHQKGLSDDAFERLYPDEEACRKVTLGLSCGCKRKTGSARPGPATTSLPSVCLMPHRQFERANRSRGGRACSSRAPPREMPVAGGRSHSKQMT